MEPFFFRLTADHWVENGKRCAANFRKAPVLSFLSGSLVGGPNNGGADADKPVAEKRKPKKGRGTKMFSDDEDDPTKLRPVKAKDATQESSDEVSDQIFEKLKQILRTKKVKKLNLFKFALHPDNFDLTVRNLFHVFALVSESKIWVRNLLLNTNVEGAAVVESGMVTRCSDFAAFG